jgi:ABC-type taurine transport system ATPase subunit
MKQRFGIAQALLANPKLIIVDEPMAGADPVERNRFLNLLSSIGRVDEKSAFAGIDPYNKLIDRESADNLVEVEKQ